MLLHKRLQALLELDRLVGIFDHRAQEYTKFSDGCVTFSGRGLSPGWIHQRFIAGGFIQAVFAASVSVLDDRGGTGSS
jgi:hypothetical protein